MSAVLLDVNVLIALLDPAHPGHDDAHEWFAANRSRWATSPLTLNGCVRVLSNPAYPSFSATIKDVVDRLRKLCALSNHEFWPEEVALMDSTAFYPEFLDSHHKITDACLLAAAVRRKGRLLTFDRGIPLRAVVGAEDRNIVLLGR